MAWVSSLAIATGNTAGTPRRYDTPQLRVYREWYLLPGIGHIANPPTVTRRVKTFLELNLYVISSALFGTPEDAYGSGNMHLDSAVGTHLWKYARIEGANNNWFCSVNLAMCT